MRIGLFADRLARRRETGVGAYIAGLASALAELPTPHEFVLFSTAEKQRPAEGLYGRMPLAWLRGNRRLRQGVWALFGRPRISAVAGPLDVLHVLVPSLPVPTTRPLVVTVHDLMALKFPRFFTRFDRTLVGLAARQLRREAAHVIAISEATRRDIVELLGVPEDRISVVHYGQPASFVPMPASAVAERLREYDLAGRPFVLFVGEITHRKNPLKLVEAFARVAPSVPDALLVVAGPPGLGYDEVVTAVDRLGLRDRVRFPGHVPHRDLPALMSGARVFVLPSAAEGFGIPALEAMMAGTPAVVSDADSLPEVVGDAGVVVPGADPDQLAAAMLTMLVDDEARGAVVARGTARLELFTWERAARSTLEVYERVGNRRSTELS